MPCRWTAKDSRLPRRPEFVERLARLVIASGAETPARLRRLAAAGNLEQIGREARTLKGVAGNLMAGEAADLALRTQLGTRGNDPGGIPLALELAVATDHLLAAGSERLGVIPPLPDSVGERTLAVSDGP